MRLSAKERDAIVQLRELDAQQREIQLGNIRRAAIANRITETVGRKVGALKQVRTVRDHKIVGAFGARPLYRLRVDKRR